MLGYERGERMRERTDRTIVIAGWPRLAALVGLVLAALAIMALAACGDDGGGGGSGSDGIKTGGSLTVTLVSENNTLDPPVTLGTADTLITQQIYDNLLMIQPDLSVKPELATSWEPNEELSSWTFQLREGVKFHNGKDFKAEDVVFSFNRLLDPVIDSPARPTFEVIEHMDDWQTLISEAARVLAPHVQLLVSTPNRIYSQESREELNPFHVHEFEYSEFESELRKRFPYVMLFLENYSDAITFIPPQEEGVRTQLGGRERDPESAHFFLAVCSKQPQHGPPAFVFVPSGGNVLREREQHVKALQEQVRELKQHVNELKQHVKALQEQVRELEQENAERARWAEELNAELESVRVDRTKLIERLDETEQRVIERSDWAMSLERELKETQQHLALLRRSIVFRISRRIGLIRDPKAEDEPMP